MMLLVILFTMMLPLTEAQTDVDVLVLGAGTAGVVAARQLYDKNVSFLIIEGGNSVGGRIRSTMFGGKMVEIGAPSIYGTNESIRDTVNLFNISGNYVDYQSSTVRTSNGTVPQEQATDAWNRLGVSKKTVKDLYGKIEEGNIPDMSIRTALQYGNWFPQNAIDNVIEIYEYDFEFSKIPELISTEGFESAAPYQEKPFMSTDQRGLQNIVESYVREYLTENDPRLKLNEVVEKISYTGSSVSVTTKSGKTFTGNYAIVTFSMGVLQSGSVTFEPVLPDWKLDTIYRTSMDVYTQVYVRFAPGIGKFWGDSQFILHANPRRGYYPIIGNMEADGFHPPGTNMIVFLIMGEEARRVERSDKATIQAEITDVLKKMYGLATPDPVDILVTKWLDDPLAMGSFTSRQIGVDNPRFMDALMSPVGKLYFAGEAYHKNLDGFAEGARFSAVDIVAKLCECMKTRKCHQFNPNPPKPATPKPTTCGANSPALSIFVLLMCWLSYIHL